MNNTELKQIRESLGMSKTEFANKLGITPMMEGRYESGGITIPERVASIAEGLAKPKKTRKKKEAEVITPSTTEMAATPSPKVEKAVEVATPPAAKEPAKPKRTRKKAAAEPSEELSVDGEVRMVIQSRLGGEISITEILSKIPDGVEKVYIKPEENRVYWVSADSAGCVELW